MFEANGVNFLLLAPYEVKAEAPNCSELRSSGADPAVLAAGSLIKFRKVNV